jgi:hypothetical protein
VEEGEPVMYAVQAPPSVHVAAPFSLTLVFFDKVKNVCSKESVLADTLARLRPRLHLQPEGFECHVDKMTAQVGQESVLLQNVVLAGALTSSSEIECSLTVILPGYQNVDSDAAHISLRSGPVQTLKLLNCPETVENGARLPLTVETIDKCGNPTTFTEDGTANLSVRFSPAFVTGTTSQTLKGDVKRASFYDLVPQVGDRSAWGKSPGGVQVRVRVTFSPEEGSSAATATEAEARFRVLPRRAAAALGFLLEGQVYGREDGPAVELKLPAGRAIDGWQIQAWDEAGRQVSESLDESEVRAGEAALVKTLTSFQAGPWAMSPFLG